MKNVIILGSGRSGTSMVAGCFAKAGYFMGENLLPANNSNPKGFFEDVEVNSINEDILASVAPKRPKLFGNLFFKHIPLPLQRWLLTLPADKNPTSTLAIDARMEKIVANQPYCLKDPRFSYTIPVWRPFFKNVAYIVVFREPMATAISIVKECKDSPPLHSLEMNIERALKVWDCMYQNILRVVQKQEDWLFIHYDQVLTPEGGKLIAEHSCADFDFSFPEKKFKRSVSTVDPPEHINAIYFELCQRAGFKRVAA